LFVYPPCCLANLRQTCRVRGMIAGHQNSRRGERSRQAGRKLKYLVAGSNKKLPAPLLCQGGKTRARTAKFCGFAAAASGSLPSWCCTLPLCGEHGSAQNFDVAWSEMQMTLCTADQRVFATVPPGKKFIPCFRKDFASIICPYILEIKALFFFS
jgi:hypothetical protein